MRGLLRILAFYFSWHWSVLLFAVPGVALLLVGVPIGLLASNWPVAVAGVFVLAFPVIWTAAVFRELVGNRRLALVPGFRTRAAAALFVIGLAGAGAGAIVSAANAGDTGIPAPGVSALLGYALVSTFLLLGQWLCTLRAGILLQLVLVGIAMRIALGGSDFAAIGGLEAVALAGTATLAWFWLFRFVRRHGDLAGPNAAQRVDSMSGSRGVMASFEWIPAINTGSLADPIGTLMRGGSNSLANRLIGGLARVVGTAVFMLLWMTLLTPQHTDESPAALGELFLIVSFIFAAAGTPILLSEWPLRLRYLWLRSPGDRGRLWYSLERKLYEEVGITAVIAILAASCLVAFVDVPPMLALAYVAGCAVVLPFSAYCAFSARMAGQSMATVSFVLMIGGIFGAQIIVGLYRGAGTTGLFALLPVVLLFGWLARRAARRRFLSADWCAVRPTRGRRAGIVSTRPS